MEREKLELTKEQATDILDGDESFFKIIENEIVDTSRWSIQYSLIIKRKYDNKFFSSYYSVGATEQQDEGPWEYDEPEFTEVFPKEKTVIVYE